ncbi:MAG: hypothetical protein FJZ01_20290 [Candidatus Sericytochromatia bacterium]|nr:hypothetical protein [Candidatus Tanganyikabacteria bacterium]
MSAITAVEREAGKAFRRVVKGKVPSAAVGNLGKDVRIAAGKVDAEVQSLIGQAEKHFTRRRFDSSAREYANALAAYEGPADAYAVLTSLTKHLDDYAQKFHLLPWNKPNRVAARFAQVKADALKVHSLGDAASIVKQSEAALAAGDRKTFEELHAYGKDLLTRIWFPFDHQYSTAKRAAMTARVERDSWTLAEHYVRMGHGDKAPAFFGSAKAPTISRPTFEREMREVLIYDKYGAMKDFTEAQGWELALAARNKFRYSGAKVEETQNALFDILRLSLKHDSKTMPARDVVAWLLNHAHTPDEVAALLARAEQMGYKVDLKADILGAITPRGLGGVTMNGTSSAVQAVNPTALVSFAEKHGFGAEASSTLMMALHGERSYRPVSTPHVTLGGLVADALNLGR